MELQTRLENALRISKSVVNGKLDPNNLYDLNLHLSEAMEQVNKITIPKKVRLDSLKVGDTFKYDLNDVGVFKIIAKNEENWINTIRTQSGRKSGDFPYTEIFHL